jgi:hypothetical protein
MRWSTPGKQGDDCLGSTICEGRKWALPGACPFAYYADGWRTEMATPGQLVEEMAASLGMPVATVTQYDRQLAEAGLRSKGGRGTSAATVTQRDAANLLIAIGASPFAGPTVKEAVRTCKAYGSLRAASQNHNFGQLGLPSLGSLPAGHSLRD